MKSRPQRDWLQIAGQFGVVASLIFVGLQMKQDQEIAVSAAYQARTATLIDFLTAISTDEVARSAMMKGFAGDNVTELTADERFALTMLSSAGRELLQNSHYQYVRGYLDEEHWQSIRRRIERQLRIPILREGLLGDGVRPSFRDAVKEIDREIRAETD
jgi:hypothetical protein